jgi:hypothetical protein
VSVVETVLGWLLSVAAFFDNLKSRRGDDPAMARHRSLKRACVLSTLFPFASLGMSFLLVNVFDALGQALRSPQAFSDVGGAVADVLLGVPVMATHVAAYNYWRLWRFERGDDDYVER